MSPQELFATLEARYRLPEGYLNRVYMLESGGGKNNYNPLSGATGPFQFMPRTAQGMGLQDPNNLAQSAEAAARLAAQNRDYLRSKGVEEVDGKLLYLAHAQGPAGAYALLSNPDAKAVDALAPLYRDRSVAEKAVTQNLGKIEQPAGDFAQSFMNRYEGKGGQQAQSYSALGRTAPVGEQEETPQEEVTSDTRRSDRREMYALNTLLGLTKELEAKPAPMLPIPRLSFNKGGIVSLVEGEEPVDPPAERMVGTRFGALPPSMLESRPDVTPVMFGGEKAEGIDPKQLELARKMIAEGADPKDVYARTRTENTTGWFVGPDGKLRFEFSDKDAALDNKVFDNLKKGGTTTLGEVLKHDDLFKYYPGAKDVTVRLLTKKEEDYGMKGSFDSKNNVLYLPSDPKQARSTVLHETQHYLQAREGFARGGNDMTARDDIRSYNTGRMLDARIEAGRLLAQEYRDHENSGVFNRLKRIVTGEKIPTPKTDKFREDILNPLKQEVEKVNNSLVGMDDYEAYRRLFGEVEARNVQTRMPLSLEERQGQFPRSTEDVPADSSYVVRRDFAKGGIVDLVTGPEQKPGINVPETTAAVVKEIQGFAKEGNLDEFKIAFLLRMAATNTIPPDRALAFANEILSGDVQALLVRFRRYPRALRMLARLDLALGGLAGQGYGIVANQHPRSKPQPTKRMGHDTKTAQAFAKGGEVGGHNEKAQFDLSKFAVAAYGPEIGNNMIRRSEGDPNKLFYALNQYAKNVAGPQSPRYKRNLAALQAIAKRHRLNPVATFNRTEDALSTEQELDKLIRDVPKKDRVFRDAMLRMKAMVGWKPKPKTVRS